MSRIIGVIADTATDTQMGKAHFEKQGYEVVCKPVKDTAAACMDFFKEQPEVRNSYMTALIDEIKAEGGIAICVYANSVCAYVDFDKLSKENNIPIITPFHAYQKAGKQYENPFVFGVTSGALAGIEANIWRSNPKADVRGIYILDIAVQIEKEIAPEQIVKNAGIAELVSFVEKSGSDCFILGCTHFPYLKKELESLAKIPVVDPIDTVTEMLAEAIRSL